MKQRTVNIIGVIYVTIAIVVASFCPSPKINRVSIIERPACKMVQENRRGDGYSERLPGSTRLPRVPEYIDGKPVKYQLPILSKRGRGIVTEEVTSKRTAIKKTEPEIKYPSNYLLIWTAEWCDKCPYMKAVGDKLKGEGFDVFYIDLEENEKKAKQDRIAGIPVAVIYTNKEEVKRVIGISEKTQKKQETRIREVLQKNEKESNNYDVY